MSSQDRMELHTKSTLHPLSKNTPNGGMKMAILLEQLDANAKKPLRMCRIEKTYIICGTHNEKTISIKSRKQVYNTPTLQRSEVVNGMIRWKKRWMRCTVKGKESSRNMRCYILEWTLCIDDIIAFTHPLCHCVSIDLA